MLQHSYIKKKRLDALNGEKSHIRTGCADNDHRTNKQGVYVARKIYTVSSGYVGEEWIWDDDKRMILTPSYKATNDTSPKFTPVGHTYEQAAKLKKFIITGGYADGLTLWNALGCPEEIGVLAIVGEAGMPALVKFIRNAIPNAAIVVAPDKDEKPSRTGQRVAMQCNCDWSLPESAEDWNDLYLLHGLDAVAREFNDIQKPLPAFDMWQLKPLEIANITRRDLIKRLQGTSHKKPEIIARLMLLAMSVFGAHIHTKYQGCNGFYNWLMSLNPFISLETSESLKRRIEAKARDVEDGARKQISIERECLAKHEIFRTSDVTSAVDYARNAKGVVIVKAPHAGGKTSVLGIPYFNDSKVRGENITVLAHLRTLVADLTAKFGTDHYLDVKEQTRCMGLQINADLQQFKAIATCLPSIVLDLEALMDRTNTLIIDEVSQVVRMLATDLKGMNNLAVFDKLREMIAKAERILVLDADFDTLTLKFLEACRGNERFKIIIVPNPSQAQSGLSVDWVYGDGYQDFMINIVHSEFALNKRIIIAADSCEKAKHIHALLKKKNPTKRILLVTADTTKQLTTDASKFIADANKEARRWDCVIHSPSIRSGLSITDVKFDTGFGFFCGATIIPQDAVQMLRRARTIKHWSVCVAESKCHLIEDERLLAKQQDDLGFNSSWDHGISAGSHDIDGVKNAIDTKENNAKNNFAAYLYLMLRHYGFKVNMLDTEAIDHEEELTQFIKGQKQDFLKAILSADKPSRDEYDQLKQMTNLTLSEEARCAAFIICEACGIDKVNEDWFDFYVRGGVTKAKRMMWALHYKELKEDDSQAASFHTFNTIRGVEAEKTLQAIGFDGYGFELNEEQAKQLIDDRIWQDREKLVFLKLLSTTYLDKRWNKSGKTTAAKKPKKPCKAAKDILEKIGVFTKSKQVRCNGEIKRILRLDDRLFSMVKHVKNHQLALVKK